MLRDHIEDPQVGNWQRHHSVYCKLYIIIVFLCTIFTHKIFLYVTCCEAPMYWKLKIRLKKPWRNRSVWSDRLKFLLSLFFLGRQRSKDISISNNMHNKLNTLHAFMHLKNKRSTSDERLRSEFFIKWRQVNQRWQARSHFVAEGRILFQWRYVSSRAMLRVVVHTRQDQFTNTTVWVRHVKGWKHYQLRHIYQCNELHQWAARGSLSV